MAGCGVRSCKRWGKLMGFQKDKNKIKTSLWLGFKGGHHIQKQLFKTTQSLPILFCAKPAVQKRSDGWLGDCCRLKKKKKCLTFPRMPFVPDHSASSSLKEAGSFLTNSQPSVLWGGSNSCFTIRSHLLRKTKNVPFLSETSGRAEHWNVINCSNWNLARTPRLTTYTYRRGKKKKKALMNLGEES